MKKKVPARLEKFRLTKGPMGSNWTDGRNGKFLLPGKLVSRTNTKHYMTVVISDASHWDEEVSGPNRWEHVSVSWPDRCPTWSEMCRIKDLFFNPHEAVIQFHPPESCYINVHPNCLHLWRPLDQSFPMPPLVAV